MRRGNTRKLATGQYTTCSLSLSLLFPELTHPCSFSYPVQRADSVMCIPETPLPHHFPQGRERVEKKSDNAALTPPSRAHAKWMRLYANKNYWFCWLWEIQRVFVFFQGRSASTWHWIRLECVQHLLKYDGKPYILIYIFLVYSSNLLYQGWKNIEWEGFSNLSIGGVYLQCPILTFSVLMLFVSPPQRILFPTESVKLYPLISLRKAVGPLSA